MERGNLRFFASTTHSQRSGFVHMQSFVQLLSLLTQFLFIFYVKNGLFLSPNYVTYKKLPPGTSEVPLRHLSFLVIQKTLHLISKNIFAAARRMTYIYIITEVVLYNGILRCFANRNNFFIMKNFKKIF